jgi:hypothetical protein
MISVVALARALYSASVLDQDTMGCLRALHDTRLEPRKIANPPVERRVRIMREEISSAWLGSHILHCLYTQEGVQDYNQIVYMKPILSQDRIATEQDSIRFYL